MAIHRENGLPFNCDEKFSWGNKCSSKFFLLIADDEDDQQDEHLIMEPQFDFKEPLESSQAQISFHALSGHLAPEILRLVGHISN